MTGEGEANISFQGKELFTVRVEGAGKISDSIVKLRAEVMTKLTAYMASESLNVNGEEPNLLEEAVSDEEDVGVAPKKGRKKRKTDGK